MKIYRKSYNDGLAVVYRDESDDNSFGAPLNPTPDSLLEICKLRFSRESIRLQDSEWADSRQIDIAMKISVPMTGKVKAGMSVLIGDELYYIEQSDPNYYEKADYLYLTGVRKIDQR